jgi:hypothetical protein
MVHATLPCLPPSAELPHDCVLQEAAARLRDHELAQIQGEIESEVTWVMALKEQRTREGAAGKNTRTLQQRVATRKSKVRKLIAKWLAWNPLARTVTEQRATATLSEESVFAGIFPWQASLNPNSARAVDVQLQYFKASQEADRTSEELRYAVVDAARIILYFTHQQHQLMLRLMEVHAAERDAQRHVLLCMLQQVMCLKMAAFDAFA